MASLAVYYMCLLTAENGFVHLSIHPPTHSSSNPSSRPCLLCAKHCTGSWRNPRPSSLERNKQGSDISWTPVPMLCAHGKDVCPAWKCQVHKNVTLRWTCEREEASHTWNSTFQERAADTKARPKILLEAAGGQPRARLADWRHLL